MKNEKKWTGVHSQSVRLFRSKLFFFFSHHDRTEEANWKKVSFELGVSSLQLFSLR